MESISGKTESFWEDPPLLNHPLIKNSPNSTQIKPPLPHQYERNLNFTTVALDEGEYGFQKKKAARDPLSHRIIEKRRRDRMNNCLADLARLLPQASLRKGRGRIEKTEIVEIAIKHLKHLQSHPCPQGENCEFSLGRQSSSGEIINKKPEGVLKPIENQIGEEFENGFQECLRQTMLFLGDKKGMPMSDTLAIQLIEYLQRCSSREDGENNILESFYPAPDDVDGEVESYTNKGHENQSQSSVKNETIMSNCKCILENGEIEYEYNAQGHRCSSTPLSIEISDDANRSSDGKKPPVPSIIGSHSSFASGSSAVHSSSNGRSSDEGSSANSNSDHRYKFKNNIKNRFNADLQEGQKEVKHHRHHHRSSTKPLLKSKHDESSSSTSTELPDETHLLTELTKISEYTLEKPMTQNNFSPLFDSVSTLTAQSIIVTSAKATIPIVSVTNMLSLKNPTEEFDEFKNNESVIKTIAGLPVITSKCTDGSEGVPAFALHEKGLFYIPLTLNKSIVSPFIAAMDLKNPHPPLHPVTISVCFLLNPKDDKIGGGGEPLGGIGKIFPELEPNGLNLKKIPVSTPPSSGSSFIMNRFTQSAPFSPTCSSSYESSSGSGSCSSRNSYIQLNPLVMSPYGFPTPNGPNLLPIRSSQSSSSGGSWGTSSFLHKGRKRNLNQNSQQQQQSSPSSSLGYHSWSNNGPNSPPPPLEEEGEKKGKGKRQRKGAGVRSVGEVSNAKSGTMY